MPKTPRPKKKQRVITSAPYTKSKKAPKLPKRKGQKDTGRGRKVSTFKKRKK